MIQVIMSAPTGNTPHSDIFTEQFGTADSIHREVYGTVEEITEEVYGSASTLEKAVQFWNEVRDMRKRPSGEWVKSELTPEEFQEGLTALNKEELEND
jgi:hypothetical protein